MKKIAIDCALSLPSLPPLLSPLVSFHLIYNYTPFPSQMAAGGM